MAEREPPTAADRAALMQAEADRSRALAEMPRGGSGFALNAVPSRGTLSDMMALAKEMASNPMLPAKFQGSPSACLFALDMAIRYNVPVLALTKNLYVPKEGQLGIMTGFLHSRLVDLKLIKGPARYSMHGNMLAEPLSKEWRALSVSAMVTDRETDTDLIATFHLETAWRAGWAQPSRSGNPSRYMIDPETQLKRRALARLINDHYPHVLTAVSTDAELDDMNWTRDAEVEATKTRTLDDLNIAERDTPRQRPQVARGGVVDPKDLFDAELDEEAP